MTAADNQASLEASVDRALGDVRALVRCDTRNPPGDERPAIDYLAKRLRSAGIEPTIVACEGRPNLVARIAGDGSGGGPLLLAGHVDVVPVEEDKWTQDPFAADIVDGYLYGRGSLDMKYVVAMALAALLRVAAAEGKPKRDLIFAALADEETGCAHGSQFLVEEHPELVRAEHMLGELGGFSQYVGDTCVYPIQVSERGCCKLKLTARGKPGHGSVPQGDSAVVRLAEAVAKLGRTRLPQHLVPTVRTFLSELARSQPPPARFALPALTNKLLSGLVLDRLMPNRDLAAVLAASLSNTVAPTRLEAGQALNVIPAEAHAYLDGRTLPGQTAADLVRELRQVVGEHLEIQVLRSTAGREGTPDEPLYRLICEVLTAHDPRAIPVPYLLTGFSDAGQLGKLVPHCYGFAPLRFPREDGVSIRDLVHGHDERIPVDGFRWGVACFCELVARWVGLEPPRVAAHRGPIR